MNGRIHLVVEGRVQGVGFRWFVQEAARARDLAGWVRNLPDGRVELAASGAPDDLDALARAVSTGPTGAVVSEVKSLPPDAAPLTRPFSILRS